MLCNNVVAKTQQFVRRSTILGREAVCVTYLCAMDEPVPKANPCAMVLAIPASIPPPPLFCCAAGG